MPTRDELATAYAGPPIALPVGDNLRRPHCYNRPPYPAGTWEPKIGYHDIMTGAKPRYLWRPRVMSSDCKAVSYTHLTLPTTLHECRSRWSPYH